MHLLAVVLYLDAPANSTPPTVQCNDGQCRRSSAFGVRCAFGCVVPMLSAALRPLRASCRAHFPMMWVRSPRTDVIRAYHRVPSNGRLMDGAPAILPSTSQDDVTFVALTSGRQAHFKDQRRLLPFGWKLTFHSLWIRPVDESSHERI